MKTLPKMHFWLEKIDAESYAGHACRAWDVPAMGVFMLFRRDEIASKKIGDRWRGPLVDWQAAVRVKLIERERELYAFYGRAFKHYLCDIRPIPRQHVR